jgi:hypothetical protein
MNGLTQAVLILTLIARMPAAADTWTNAAGYALDATPVALDGTMVTLLIPSGGERRMPLHSFLPGEQRRIKESLGILDVPGPLRSTFRLAQSQIETAQALYEDGRIDEREHAGRRNDVIQTFLKMCEYKSYPRDSVEVQNLLRQLL